MSGKGSRPRPFSVSDEEYANRWDAIFGRDLKKEEPKDLCDICGNPMGGPEHIHKCEPKKEKE